MRAVLASQNQGKLKELSDTLAPAGIQLINQDELNIDSVPETGLTFVENALIKARHVSASAALPAFGDDSGLVVHTLKGEPGIRSARYAGQHGDDDANNAKLINELDGQADRSAYFYCALVFVRYETDPCPLIATAAWHGEILEAPKGDGGFGYDPLFYLPELGLTAAQLDKKTKNAISHRGLASAAMRNDLAQNLKSG
jgi:XTP/dITP diphosphohydrolase